MKNVLILKQSSPRGQVSGYQVYTNIFGKYLEVFTRSGMKAYVITEKDFLQYFSIVNNSNAELKHGGYEKKIIQGDSQASDSETESSRDKSDRIRKRASELRNRRRIRKALQRS